MTGANLTKKALSESMKKLMYKEHFEKISVVQICDVCGINRKSFYYHFKDKYDLVSWIFYTEFMQCINNVGEGSSWDYIRAICEYFYENKKFYINAFSIEGQNSFADMFNENISLLASEYLEKIIADKKLQQFYCNVFSDAMRCSIIRWLRDDDAMSVDEFVSIFKDIEKNIAQAFIGGQG